MGNSNCFQSSDDEEEEEEDDDGVAGPSSDGYRRVLSATSSASARDVAHGIEEAATHTARTTLENRFTSLERQQQLSRRPVMARADTVPSGDAVQSRPSPVLLSRRQEDNEEETARRLRLAQRMGFIYQLPTGVFDGSKKARECAICMLDFEVGEHVRYLPCMHAYHQGCIDDWLLRSFTCPSCMQPVDAALLSSFGCPDD